MKNFNVKNIFLITMLLSMLLVLNCANENPANSDTDNLIPLKVGNSWTYLRFNLNTVTGDTISKEQDTITIAGTMTIGGSEYFSDDEGGVLQNRDDGLFIAGYNPNSGKFFDDFFLKFPVQNGETYSYQSIESGMLVNIMVATRTLVVPAGTFSSYVYRFVDEAFESSFAFTPGTGLIRTTNFDNEGENLILTAFTLN